MNLESSLSDQRERANTLRAAARVGSRSYLVKILVAVGLLLLSVGDFARGDIPKNIILMIGDGMGFEHVEAARYAAGDLLPFERFTYQGEVITSTANSSAALAPDSAATATAMATGQKVNNGVISVATPGDGSPLTTVLEIFQTRGKATGLVTNVPISHATPAAFAAHQANRNNYGAITDDILSTKPNVLMGSVVADGAGMTIEKAQTAGYQVVTNRAELNALDRSTAGFVSGQFGVEQMPYEHDGSYDTLPHLSEMTTAALEFLQPDPDGLFLVVEGGLIDWAAHGSGLADKSDPLRLERTVGETLEFGRAVQSVLDWAGDRNDTLVLVTADHETGGLDFSVTTDADGNPVVRALWSTTGHTGANVPLYAWGPGAQNFSGLIDNTDLFQISTVSVPEPSAAILLSTGVLAGGLFWLTRRR